MRPSSLLALAPMFTLVLAGCAPSPAAPPAGGAGVEARAPTPDRTLVVITRAELPSLGAKPLVGYSGSLHPGLYLFNATLERIDENNISHPYLEETLPKLNSETWRVFPDGTMETVHKLRPNLTWHDGKPLTAEDFVFAWRVYATPEIGVSGTAPIKQIAEVAAADPRTLSIRWNQPYPDADRMERSYVPLPRHILSDLFQQGDRDVFVNDSFWTFDYVGLGPYKLTSWEPGAFIEAQGFEGHALGRPKIDRLKVLFIGDSNTALANLLSGDAHYIADFILGHQDGVTLEEQWAATGGGTVFFAPVLIRFSQIQHRPEYAKPKALLDRRFREALAHAFDTEGAVEAFTGGKGLVTYTLSWPRIDYYPEIKKVITERKHDPRRTQQLLEEAGMRRGADGFYVSPTGESLHVELWNTGGSFERENRVFADSLRKAGIDATPQTLGPARLRDAEFRALIGGLFTGGLGNDRFTPFTTDSIARPETRWRGTNRGAWYSREYDRAWQAWKTTLEPAQRIQHIARMEQLINEDVAIILHYFTDVITAHSSLLKGVVARRSPDVPLQIYRVETWEWTS